MKFKHILLLIIITSLLLIKVYVANELYYTSRNIQKLSIQINALKEERNILKLKIEKLKYKNTIIDPLFEYKPKEEEQTPKDTTQDIQEQKKEPQIPKKEPKKRKKQDTKELFENLDIDNNVDEGLI
jgi:hypothetical protein